MNPTIFSTTSLDLASNFTFLGIIYLIAILSYKPTGSHAEFSHSLKYFDVYSSDPASAKGRFDGPYRILKEEFEFVRPTAASEADLQLLRTVDHIERIRRTPHLYEIATLAVGGGILASEIVMGGGVAFALIRPPGHHASPNSLRWVFCFFNNIAIAVKKLLDSGRASRALIVDFDLHFGDGAMRICNRTLY